MSESGSEGSERAAEEVARALAENAQIFHVNGGVLIDLLKELSVEKIRPEQFKARYAQSVDSEVPLPDEILAKIWDLRRYLREGPPRSNFFHFLGVRRLLTMDQANLMKAEQVDVVKEEPEDPSYPDSQNREPSQRRRRVSKELWTCACGRKFQAYVPLVVHANNCPKVDRLPQVEELPSGFIGKMRSGSLTAAELLEAWNSLIPPAPQPQLMPPTSVPAPGPGSAPIAPPGGLGQFPPQTPFQPQRPPFMASNGVPTSGPGFPGMGFPNFPPSPFPQQPPFPFPNPMQAPPAPQGPQANFGQPPPPQPPSSDALPGLFVSLQRSVEMLCAKVDTSVMKINSLEKKLLDLENLQYRSTLQVMEKMDEIKPKQ